MTALCTVLSGQSPDPWTAPPAEGAQERIRGAAEERLLLREQVVMVPAVENHAAGKVADLVASGAALLPKLLWSAPCEPYIAWTKALAGRTDRMIETDGSTDVFLKKTVQRLEDWSAAVRNAAREAIAAEPVRGTR